MAVSEPTYELNVAEASVEVGCVEHSDAQV